MTPKAIPLLALLTALCAACNGRSPHSEPGAAAPDAIHEHSSGSEHGFPDPQTYAEQLDDPARDEWQRPEEVIGLLECRPGMTAADIGAGTGYFIGHLSRAVEPEVIAAHRPPPSRRLTYDTVVRELQESGFEAEILEESLPYQYVIAGRVP